MSLLTGQTTSPLLPLIQISQHNCYHPHATYMAPFKGVKNVGEDIVYIHGLYVGGYVLAHAA